MNSKNPEWYYDETKQVGIDYNSIIEVEKYDTDAKYRDIEEEIKIISHAVNLQKDFTVLEFGTGTGELGITLAKNCKKVIAADVSKKMLDYASKKAADRGIKNIEFVHSGFLTYEKRDEVIDAIVSQIALHHLPEFWKMIAIRNMYNLLKTGGKLCLIDCILSFDVNDFDNYMSNYLKMTEEVAGKNKAKEFIINIRDEFPAFDWVIENMLKKAGFTIDRIERYEGYFAGFICTKK
jgi:ubiquinone/menaquinone biosynthesis C-methylase UbiE